LFKYEKKRNEIIQIDETSFSNENLTEPQNIEIWIRKNPSILSEVEGEELIIIGEQQASETKKRLDLLGVDKFGNIVIIELKRDLAEEMVENQAITYASSYVYSTFKEVCNIYAKYLEKNKNELKLSEITEFQEFKKEAEKSLENFCSSINIPDDFNKNQRIILVAGNFSKNLLSAVTWLILKGIKIECIDYHCIKTIMNFSFNQREFCQLLIFRKASLKLGLQKKLLKKREINIKNGRVGLKNIMSF